MRNCLKYLNAKRVISETDLIAWIAEYVLDEEVQKGLRLGRYKIEYLDYEYNINGKRDYGKRDIMKKF